MPRLAIDHLKKLVLKLLPIGIHRDFMTARVSLLAKVDRPSSMEDRRPISILATTYRLVSKVLFQQVAQAWSSLLPREVSGGLLRRSVRDIALMQASTIEEAIMASKPVTGSTTDLAKPSTCSLGV